MTSCLLGTEDLAQSVELRALGVLALPLEEGGVDRLEEGVDLVAVSDLEILGDPQVGVLEPAHSRVSEAAEDETVQGQHHLLPLRDVRDVHLHELDLVVFVAAVDSHLRLLDGGKLGSGLPPENAGDFGVLS